MVKKDFYTPFPRQKKKKKALETDPTLFCNYEVKT